MGNFGFVKQLTISVGLYPQARALHRMLYRTERRKFYEHRRLLSRFVKADDLAFDVGANIGNRTEILLSLGARVVAFEPQPICAREIAAHRSDRLIVIQKAVGSAEGTAKLFLKSSTGQASLLSEWQGANSGTQNVEITTLDKSIEQFGVPTFCKIDIEGFEPDALEGLSYKIPALSLEYHCDDASIERTRQCLDILSKLDVYSVNLTAEDEAALLLPRWLPIPDFLRSFPSITGGHFWGDIFVAAARAAGATTCNPAGNPRPLSVPT